MDLENGELLIESPEDAQDVIAGFDNAHVPIGIERRRDLNTVIPNRLSASETQDLVAALNTTILDALQPWVAARRAGARQATETLKNIADLGAKPSAQLGSSEELEAAEPQQDTATGEVTTETPPTAG
ncbi:MAG TPA: hypothetical protein VII55_01815 [Candidatus Saccharimonadales bacterium]